MGFRKYSKQEFKKLEKQHNIMAFVGNGFDIQTMLDNTDELDSEYKCTQFATFFEYLCDLNYNVEDIIFKKMTKLKEEGKEDWSDIETAIGAIALEQNPQPAKLIASIASVQQEFANFLRRAVSSELQGAVGNCSQKHQQAVNSLSNFCGDILATDRGKSFKFASKTKYYDLFNFLFINFNFTSLLDNFIHLDQGQFHPQPHRTGDRNFSFKPNPNNAKAYYRATDDQFYNWKTKWSSNVLIDVVHPHGRQEIPRSLLFGIDSSMVTDKGLPKELAKPFWGQNELLYKDHFMETELFIIFGCSLGRSDGWWWRGIVKQLSTSDQAELVIYWWQSTDTKKVNEQHVINQFFEVASITNAAIREILQDRIFVVLHNSETKRYWLNTKYNVFASRSDQA